MSMCETGRYVFKYNNEYIKNKHPEHHQSLIEDRYLYAGCWEGDLSLLENADVVLWPPDVMMDMEEKQKIGKIVEVEITIKEKGCSN